MKQSFHKVLLVLSLLIYQGCTEEIPLQQETEFEEVLVVEATITNELKNQVIMLSKAFRLDEAGPKPETNATVKVIDENGVNYDFSETENGIYTSNTMFAAQPNIDYHLEIITGDGKTYNSTNMSFSQPTKIDNIYAERDFNENGEEGVSIYVDTEDATNSSKYYRYVYKETYKIIAPTYSPLKLNVLNDDFPIDPRQFSSFQEIQDYLVELVNRDKEVRICYNTALSNNIIIANTNNFEEDNLKKFRVRFLNRDNYIISHRYSILIEQYVQSPEAHNFYDVLKAFSISESIFSENQLGFLQGNLSANNDNNKVIGFFEVSAVDSKRIYFNYVDLFPSEDLPPYYIFCDDGRLPQLFRTDPFTGDIVESDLQDLIKEGFQYFSENPGNIPEFSGPFFPYLMVPPACGDCTVLGETKVPDFWEE